MLEVKNLVIEFQTLEGVLRAVDNVSFSVQKGRTLGLVGESGCGKSVTALSILRLIQDPGKIISGQIIFNNQDLLSLNEKSLQKIRGKQISMIFQEPMTSLNPAFTIGHQIGQVIGLHQKKVTGDELNSRVLELLHLVNIPEPEKKLHMYPHQLSGGLRQRAMIAMALSCDPLLLIADEPTTALDVTIQAQILELMRELQKRFNTGLILISHDLGVIAETCDNVAVMYAGQIIESGAVEDIFYRPKHPYTRGLLDSIPVAGSSRQKLHAIAGSVPSLDDLPKGCRFYDRCGRRHKDCALTVPALTGSQQLHQVACFYPLKEAELL